MCNTTRLSNLWTSVMLDGLGRAARVLHNNNLLVRTALDSKLLRWIDDILAHSDSESAHLVLLHGFFSLCAKHGLKLHARK
jgi:hypothetical protein